MARKLYLVKFRRRREGKTDYKKRLALVKSKLPILTVRRTNTQLIAHIREYSPQGDITKLMITSRKLKDYGWNAGFKNLPSSYLTGYLFGKLAIKAGIKKAVFDIGRHASTKGSRLYAFLKGCVDAGMDIPYSPDNFPSEDRILGKHISEDMEKMFKKVMDNIEKLSEAKEKKKSTKVENKVAQKKKK